MGTSSITRFVFTLTFNYKSEKEIKMRNKVIYSIIAVLVSASFIFASDHDKSEKDIVETAVAAGSFKTLATALTEAGLVDALKGEGPFTVFAPTDDAFAKLPEGTLESLLKDKEALKNILLYHVVSGSVMAADVVKLDKAETLSGQEVYIKVKGDNVMINKSKVVKADIKAKNGVIHVIDTVLIPEKKSEKKEKKKSY
jgi:uncharacterized surface protein with fasciclin (FAS1) repeats